MNIVILIIVRRAARARTCRTAAASRPCSTWPAPFAYNNSNNNNNNNYDYYYYNNNVNDDDDDTNNDTNMWDRPPCRCRRARGGLAYLFHVSF